MSDADNLDAFLIQGFDAVPRESAVTAVARQLLDRFTSGRVAPGARLPSERQLSTSLKVGRSAVREALAALDILGIVDIRPGSGTYLRTTSSDILPRTINWGMMLGQPRTHDLVEVRQGLEVLSARLAAERATDDEITRIETRVSEMQRAVDHDVSKFVDSDVAFHLEVAMTAKNSVLSDLLHSIRELLRVWIERTSGDKVSAQESLAEHVIVYQAIASRDPVEAQRAMQAHMASASARLSRVLAAGQV